MPFYHSPHVHTTAAIIPQSNAINNNSNAITDCMRNNDIEKLKIEHDEYKKSCDEQLQILKDKVTNFVTNDSNDDILSQIAKKEQQIKDLQNKSATSITPGVTGGNPVAVTAVSKTIKPLHSDKRIKKKGWK